MAGIALWAVFQGILLPSISAIPASEGAISVNEIVAVFYIGIIGVSILAGMVLADFAKSLGGVIIAYLLESAIVFEALSAPGLSNSTLNDIMLITRNGLTLAAIDLTFRVMFPFPIFALLIGTIFGTALAEHYY